MAQGNRSSAKGRERMAAVLAASEQILKANGPEGLTLRAVAEVVGMSVGNLQYYLPTRAALLDAVFRAAADRFRTDLIAALPADPDPRSELLAIVDHWLAAQDTEDQALFWHLWAISAHDDDARATMEDVYGELLTRVAALLRAIHPGLRAADSVRRAAAIGALVDGSGLYVGFGRRPSRALASLRAEIRLDVAAIVDRVPAGG